MLDKVKPMLTQSAIIAARQDMLSKDNDLDAAILVLVANPNAANAQTVKLKHNAVRNALSDADTMNDQLLREGFTGDPNAPQMSGGVNKPKRREN